MSGDFQEDAPHESLSPAQLMLELDGFEGPIDMLLTLAREQKVDLAKISILKLADQYLAFVAELRKIRLELAADYLVMAAWLAYLKSRLLIPEQKEDEPSGEDLAAALAFQLQRLEAMKGAAQRLMSRPRLGVDVFPCGAPEDLGIQHRSVFQVSLYDLLKAYGEHKRRQETGVLHVEPMRLYSIEDALKRLSEQLGRTLEWAVLADFLPRGLSGTLMGPGTLMGRSVLAAHFAATLELVKAGQVELRQDAAFGPLWMRRARPDQD